MDVVNLTPHEVKIYVDENTFITIPKAEEPLRLEEESEFVDAIELNGYDIMIYSKKYHPANELPPEEEDVYYIVSALVARAYPNRHDFLIPNDMIRDDDGRIVMCRSFSTL